jgi:hypothetical protein
MFTGKERRGRRSEDLALALQYLLSSHRDRGLTHILLCTNDGILLAFDGDRAECEELAAYAPFVARGQGYVLDPRRLAGLSSHPFQVGKENLFLLIRGEPGTETLAPVLMASIEGVVRILGS